MTLPKKISPCPIVESLIEVRFESELPGEAIFGIIYNEHKNDFPNLVKLPILQIPEAIRSSDKNLIYAPHYTLRSGNYILQIGPQVFSLANVHEYAGWDTFYGQIKNVFKRIIDLKIIKKTKRLGLRYINVFPEMNIFEKSDLKVFIKEDLLVNRVNLTIDLPSNEFINTLRMASDANLDASGKILMGSVIDIDTSFSGSKPVLFPDMEEIIQNAHDKEKELFFNLLRDDYIESLNPEY